SGLLRRTSTRNRRAFFMSNASMRPQRIAAENTHGTTKCRHGRCGFNEAAADCCGEHGIMQSSMHRMACCFNEAAADCCGELPQDPDLLGLRHASMRPQRIAAENERNQAWP